jgi:hypothetical protein
MSNNQLNTESIKFRVGLSGIYWNKKPSYSVGVNGTVYKTGIISAESGVTEHVEFECEIPEGDNRLEITLSNKEDSDVVQNQDKSAIVNDLLLNIESVEIDEIDLGSLKWTASEFVPVDTTKPTLKSCVNLGWNGTYSLAFTSPFYLWLLENT